MEGEGRREEECCLKDCEYACVCVGVPFQQIVLVFYHCYFGCLSVVTHLLKFISKQLH